MPRCVSAAARVQYKSTTAGAAATNQPHVPVPIRPAFLKTHVQLRGPCLFEVFGEPYYAGGFQILSGFLFIGRAGSLEGGPYGTVTSWANSNAEPLGRNCIRRPYAGTKAGAKRSKLQDE